MLAGLMALGGCSSSVITGVYGTPTPESTTQPGVQPLAQPVARVDIDPDAECPAVNVPSGAASYGSPTTSQFSISNFARECNLASGNTVTMKIGVEGHVVLAGSGGGSYSAPVRISVRDRDERVVYTKVIRVSANVAPGEGQGSFRAVDTTDPIEIGLQKPLNSYDITIGFDGKGAGAAAPVGKKKKRHG